MIDLTEFERDVDRDGHAEWRAEIEQVIDDWCAELGITIRVAS